MSKSYLFIGKTGLMVDKKKLARDFATNKRTFDSDFPYLNDIEFLTHLKDVYEEMQEYEVCMIIEARIKIFSAKEITDEALDNLNMKINLYKASKRNLN